MVNRGRPPLTFYQLTAAIISPPLEHLVSVHAFGLRHTRHAHPWLKNQLHDPALLRNAAMYALRLLRPYTVHAFHVCIINLELTTYPEGKTPVKDYWWNPGVMTATFLSTVSRV